MSLLQRFGEGLRCVRKSRGLTQEDFSTVSSRTYLSSLERGLKAPTITKVDELASIAGVHPVSLFALAYVGRDPEDITALCVQLRSDLESLASAQ